MKEKWLKPPETKDISGSENPHHRLSIEVDGKEIGKAELVYFGSPIRFYYLDNIRVDPDYRGLRFGSKVIEAVNKFLDTKKVPGLLLNIIEEGTKSRDLYERHGWQPVSFRDVMIYSKKDLPGEVLREMVLRFTKWYNRDIRIEAA